MQRGRGWIYQKRIFSYMETCLLFKILKHGSCQDDKKNKTYVYLEWPLISIRLFLLNHDYFWTKYFQQKIFKSGPTISKLFLMAGCCLESFWKSTYPLVKMVQQSKGFILKPFRKQNIFQQRISKMYRQSTIYFPWQGLVVKFFTKLNSFQQRISKMYQQSTICFPWQVLVLNLNSLK